MSSYVTFYLINKKDFEEYSLKLKEIKEKNKDNEKSYFYYDPEEDALYRDLRKSCIVCLSRSNPLYTCWTEEHGYSEELKKFDESSAKSVLESMKKRVQKYKDEIKSFEETGLFDINEVDASDLEKCILFIKAKKDLINKNDDSNKYDLEMFNKTLKYLKRVSFDTEDQSWKQEAYEEMKDSIGEYEFSISALETVLNVHYFNEYGDEELYWIIG